MGNRISDSRIKQLKAIATGDTGTDAVLIPMSELFELVQTYTLFHATLQVMQDRDSLNQTLAENYAKRVDAAHAEEEVDEYGVKMKTP